MNLQGLSVGDCLQGNATPKGWEGGKSHGEYLISCYKMTDL